LVAQEKTFQLSWVKLQARLSKVGVVVRAALLVVLVVRVVAELAVIHRLLAALERQTQAVVVVAQEPLQQILQAVKVVAE
jgi:hypothetical protein